MTREEISQAIIDILNDIVPDEDWSALRFKPFKLIDNPVRKEKMIKADE